MSSPPLDILFIHPGNQKRNYQDLAKEFTAIATPAWTLLLAGHLLAHGGTTAIYDVNVRGWDAELPAELFQDSRPKLVVIMVYGHHPSASTQTMPAAAMIAADIKAFSPDILIAFGGTHPSALPEQTLLEEPIDFVIQGEAVLTLSDYLDYVKGERDLSAVRGLWSVDQNGSPICHAAPENIQDLDRLLPRYPWELLGDLARYRAHNMHCFQDFEQSGRDDFSDVRSPYVTINTSLGCPYSCHYCCIHALFGRPGVRYWSLQTVVSWIDELVITYGVKNIRIDDELFLLDPVRVNEFCDLLIARQYDLNLWVYGRIDTICEDVLPKMRRAGIRWICLGIETADDAVRADVNKALHTDIKAVVAAIRRSGIYVLGNYMFGLPLDTKESMQKTLDLAKELNTEFINFYTVMAYPGSRLYQQARLEGATLPDSWNGYSQHSYDAFPLATRALSSAEVLRFRDGAFENYFQGELYQEMLQNTFGEKVVQHVKRMMSVRIKRKLYEKNEGGDA